MRTRDEVLRERDLKDAPIEYNNEQASAWCSGYDTAIERIRELEAQQAASEPVAWVGHVRQLERCMAFQCGVAFALCNPSASTEEQAQAARAYSSGSHQPHQSAAAVTVTEACVNEFAKQLCFLLGTMKGPYDATRFAEHKQGIIKALDTAIRTITREEIIAATSPTTPTRGSDE